MTFSTIRLKLVVLITTTLLFFVGINYVYNVSKVSERAQSHLNNSTLMISKTLLPQIEKLLTEQHYGDLRKLLSPINNPFIETIEILNLNGHILSGSAQKNMQTYPLFQSLLKLEKQQLRNDVQHVTMTPVIHDHTTLGYLIVEANIDYYHKEITKETNIVLLLTLFYIAISTLAAFLISRSIALPLEAIIAKIHATKANEYLHFEQQPQVEYQYLANAISQKHNSLLELTINLEEEVAKKTLQLQELNNSLELKVDEAITNLQKKEQLLQQQSRHAQMGEMISMIAHQWRQPLSAISATAFSILIKTKRKKFDQSTPEGLEKYNTFLQTNIESIQKYVQFLSTTIDDFRNFFRPEKLKEQCSFDDIITKTLQIAEVSLTNKNIQLTKALQSHCHIHIYKNEVTQALLNILKNAEDNFIERDIVPAQIIIRAYEQNRFCFLEIEDNGGGIDTSIIDKIFDPYFSTKEEKNGTGLGLYMSKVIVEDHNSGRLEVENRSKGACFIFSFPIV